MRRSIGLPFERWASWRLKLENRSDSRLSAWRGRNCLSRSLSSIFRYFSYLLIEYLVRWLNKNMETTWFFKKIFFILLKWKIIYLSFLSRFQNLRFKHTDAPVFLHYLLSHMDKLSSLTVHIQSTEANDLTILEGLLDQILDSGMLLYISLWNCETSKHDKYNVLL